MLLITWPASLATVAVAFGELAVRGAEALERGGSTGEGKLVGGAMVVLLALLNLRGLKLGSRAEITLFFAKVSLLLFVCVAALVAAPAPVAAVASERAARMPTEALALLAAVGAAMKNVLFSYDGYADAVYMAGETENPGKALPRALFVSLLTITGLYVAANATFVHVLGADGLANSKFAALDVAQRAFGADGASLLAVVAMVILLGAANSYFLTGPRIARVLAEDGIAPAALGRMTESGAPPQAVLLVLGMALFYVATGSFDLLLSITIPIISATVALVAIGLLVQRRRAPDRPRPFRVPFAPVVVLLQVAIGVFLVSGYVLDNPEAVAIDAGALLLGLCVFSFMRRRR
jgi:APA family basic amino acid/polyamine antiporter